jgi:methyl-accepting chemotaxis protein
MTQFDTVTTSSNHPSNDHQSSPSKASHPTAENSKQVDTIMPSRGAHPETLAETTGSYQTEFGKPYLESDLDRFSANGVMDPPPGTPLSPMSRSPQTRVAPRYPTAQPIPAPTDLSLRRDMVLQVLPWVIAPVGAASLLGYLAISQQAEETLQNQVIAVSRATRDRVNSAQKVPRLVAPDPTIVEFARQTSSNPNNRAKPATPQLRQSVANSLRQTAGAADLTELLTTDQTGTATAASRPLQEALQQQMKWWKPLTETGSATQFVYDSAGAIAAVDFAQAIVDPNTGQFLGSVKGRLGADALNRTLSAFANQNMSESEQVQILVVDQDTIKPISTLTNDGLKRTNEVIGGKDVSQRALTLIQQQQSQLDSVSTQPSIRRIDLGNGDRSYATLVANNGRRYLLSTIPNTNWVAVASSSQVDLGLDPGWGWGLAAVVLLLAGVATAAISRSSRRLSSVLVELNEAVTTASIGNLGVRVNPQGPNELKKLTQSFNRLVTQLDNTLNRQSEATEQAQFYADLAQAASKGDTATVFDLTVQTAKQQLGADRVVIYCFEQNWSGKIVAEAVNAEWPRALNDKIADPCIPQDILEEYRKGRYVPTSDVSQMSYSKPHRQLLERLQVKANLVVPIVASDRLLGLLVAHQCADIRLWQQHEINFLRELAAQVGLALTGTTLAAQKAEEAERARQLNRITFKMREVLDEGQIYASVVEGTRDALRSDRALVYLFDANWQGKIVAESVEHPWTPALNAKIADPCFAANYVEKYRRGRVQALPNIDQANLDPCYKGQLEPFEVKANLVAPILVGDQLKGLLVTHQCSAPRFWKDSEINFFRQVAIQLGFALDQAALLRQQKDAAQKAQQLNDIAFRMRESLNREQIFNLAVQDTKEILACDRVVVYLFDARWQGKIVAESVNRGFPVALGAEIEDPCFAQDYIEKYKRGRVQALDNIYESGLDSCYMSQLEPFEIKANLVAPILAEGNLLGLLVAHQCSAPRHWQPSEINFLRQTGIQLGFALEQAALSQQKETARLQAEAISQEQRQQKESLQAQLVLLLKDVEGAASGDLTVRADVTPGEIGTVADFFNSIVESLRTIVTQVKQSALQVGTALGENEHAMQQLAEEAMQQAEETKQTLQSVEQMQQLIQTAASSARQASEMTHQASSTAEAGGIAMDLTVQNILGLRETIGETAKKVKRLGESSQQISKVVSLIHQVAMQTNLLAINAGIEAARAGDGGQGFAVVAEEVGELAARSAAATQEIEQIVDTIQRETHEVVEAMEQGTSQVVEGTHLVGNAKQSLEQILRVSHQIDDLVRLVSDATTAQVQTSQAIASLMQDTAKVAGRTSASSRQVSNSLRRTVSVAKKLQDSVETFNVG